MHDVIIKNGNMTQYAHRADVLQDEQRLPSASIQEDINAISSFQFVIYPNNQCYNSINPFSTSVCVYNRNRDRYDFIGRVLKISPAMDADGAYYKTVICESRLAYLCDTVQPYTAEKTYVGDNSRNGLQEFIDVVLANHNLQVEDDKKIYRGVVTVDPFTTSENVHKGLNWERTWDVIQNKLIGSFGGEIELREVDGVLYLDYKPSIGQTRSTTIELAKNIESMSRTIDSTKIITRLVPLGCKKTINDVDEAGNKTQKEIEDRLTIESVNGGKKYIEDVKAAAQYGIIYGTVTFDDVTIASNLKTKGEAYLAANNMIEISDNVSALDLSEIGLDIDDFSIADRYPVKNALLGVNETLRIVKKTTNVIEPYASSFNLGNRTKYLSDVVNDYKTEIIDIIDKKESEKHTDTKNRENEIYTYINTKVTEIQKSTEGIELSVKNSTVTKSEYEEFEKIVKHILSIDENGTTMLFETINKAIEEVDGRQETNYNSILKYIRFVGGEIILGEEGNAMTLTISNNRMSFQQNGVEVAYMSNNKLYIGNAEIKAGGTMQIGNFAFVPRADGSLSFLKVGE